MKGEARKGGEQSLSHRALTFPPHSLPPSHLNVHTIYFTTMNILVLMLGKAEGEGNNRGRDSWMASLTQWTWVWASSGRWWRTGKPGMLQSMGSQRVRHSWATEQQAYFNTPIFPKHLLLSCQSPTNLSATVAPRFLYLPNFSGLFFPLSPNFNSNL